MAEWRRESGVECVVAPCCGFTFDAGHEDVDGGGYSCPACDEIKLRTAIRHARFRIGKVENILDILVGFIDPALVLTQIDPMRRALDEAETKLRAATGKGENDG